MSTYISRSDLAASLPGIDEARIDEAIEDAEAWALFYAPALKSETVTEDADKMAQVKAIMRRAIKHALKTEDGSLTQHSAGPFASSHDTRTYASSTFYSAAQIAALRGIANPPIILNGAYTVSVGFPDAFPYYRS